MQHFKFLFFLLLFFVLVNSVKGQKPSGFPITHSTGWIEYGYLMSDSGLICAVRDTNFIARYPGTMVYWQHAGVDSAIWISTGRYTGLKWTKFSGSSGGGGSSDTVLVNLPLYVLDSASKQMLRADTVTTPYGLVTHNALNDSLARFKGNYFGTTYDQKAGTFNLSNDFNINGATVSDSSGTILISGGANTLRVSLDQKYDKNHAINPFYHNYERWRLSARITIINTGLIWLGMRSATINSPDAGAFAFLNTATGSFQFEGAASTLAMSIHDVLEVVVERDVWNTYMQVRNITTNSAPVTVTGNYSLTSGVVPVTGRFAIGMYTPGNKIYLDSLNTAIYAPINADLLVIGDSKTEGYNANNLTRFTTQLQGYYNTISYGGGFETTADWLLSVPAIIAAHPISVILTNPSNDLRTGINTDSTKARYGRIEQALRAAGIRVYHSDGFYETNTDPINWVNYIHATRSADSIIYTYNATNITGVVSGDGIHPNSLGDSLILQSIVSSGKIISSVNPAFASKNTIVNQIAAIQHNSGFNIADKNSILAAHLDVGNATTTQTQLRVLTETDNNLRFGAASGTNNISAENNAGSVFQPLHITSSNMQIITGAAKTTIDATSLGNVNVYGQLYNGEGTDLDGTYSWRTRTAADNYFRTLHVGSANYLIVSGFNDNSMRNFTTWCGDYKLQSNTVNSLTISSGAFKFDNYGTGTHTGTPAYTLQVDASGNVIEGSGGVATNIYTADGTLGGNRLVTGGGNSFTVNGTSSVQLVGGDFASYPYSNFIANTTSSTVTSNLSAAALSQLVTTRAGLSGFNKLLGSGFRVNTGSGSNLFYNYLDSNRLAIKADTITVESILSGVGTKALRYDPSTKRITIADTTAGGGSAALTAKYIGFGDGSNILTGNTNLQYDLSGNTVTQTGADPTVILNSTSGVPGLFFRQGGAASCSIYNTGGELTHSAATDYVFGISGVPDNILFKFLGGSFNSAIRLGGSGNPTSTMDIRGSIATAVVSTAIDYSATDYDKNVLITATGKTVTLPTAVGIKGREYTIKLTAIGTGTVATTSSQTIDGSTTYSLTGVYKYVTVVSDNANWSVIANN